MRAGVLRVISELAGADFHLPEGSRISGQYEDHDTPSGCVTFVIEGDWLPDTVAAANLPEIQALYTTDYETRTCHGRFACGDVVAEGPIFALPVSGGPVR